MNQIPISAWLSQTASNMTRGNLQRLHRDLVDRIHDQRQKYREAESAIYGCTGGPNARPKYRLSLSRAKVALYRSAIRQRKTHHHALVVLAHVRRQVYGLLQLPTPQGSTKAVQLTQMLAGSFVGQKTESFFGLRAELALPMVQELLQAYPAVFSTGEPLPALPTSLPPLDSDRAQLYRTVVEGMWLSDKDKALLKSALLGEAL